MTTVTAKRLARGIAILAILWAAPLYAQLEVGTWVRTPTEAMPDSMTMKIEVCRLKGAEPRNGRRTANAGKGTAVRPSPQGS